ncbi:hypothetical protein Leryth_026865 [Lithospermum erythrorhizon]|nr:hypothetical protein Leryth_026865 [Lithospermum erythrorhizon]
MMILVQSMNAGMVLLYRVASHYGMSIKVLIAYRFMIAAVVIGPFAYYIERNKRPIPTRMIVFQSFACALFGQSLVQNFYAESIKLTSATFASAMTNLLPGLTFLIAILFRLENLMLNTIAGKAKVMGTTMGICGAMILTFYKGSEILTSSAGLNILECNKPHHQSFLGPVLAIISCLSAAFSFNIQKLLSDNYPYPYSSTALICVFGAIQSVVYALAFDRDWSHWKLEFNISLLVPLYAGLVASVVVICIMSWCFQVKSPLFVAVFNPLMPIIVAIASKLLLDEKLYLGSIIGSVIIVCGLYLVLWGKAKDTTRGPHAEGTDMTLCRPLCR